MKEKPLTVYPPGDVRMALEQISAADNDRPLAHVAAMAIKAYAVQWKRDKFAAMKLADEFDTLKLNRN